MAGDRNLVLRTESPRSPSALAPVGLLPVEYLRGGMTPRQAGSILHAYRGWILGVTAVVVVVAGAISAVMPKTWEATASVLVNYGARDPATGEELGAYLSSSYLSTQVDLLGSPQVLLEVANRVAWPEDAVADLEAGSTSEHLLQRLTGNLTIAAGRESRLVRVSYSDQDRDIAVAVANAVVEVYLEQYGGYSRLNVELVQNLKAQLVEQEEKLARMSKSLGPRHPDYIASAAQLNALRQRLEEELNVDSAAPGASAAAAPGSPAKRYTNARLVSLATPPLNPSKPRVLVNLVLALAVGLLLGVGSALLRELLHRRVRSRDDIERELGVPVLAEFRADSNRPQAER